MLCASERLLSGPGIAIARLAGDVATCFGPDEHRVLGNRVPGRDDGGKRLVLHLDRFDGIACDGQALGDHRSNRFADVPDRIDCEGVTRGRRSGRAIRALEIRRKRHGLQALAHEIRTGDDRDDARHR